MNIQKTFEKYKDIYTEVRNNLENREKTFLLERRDIAFSKFVELGIPDHTNEEYKYADITQICSKDYFFEFDQASSKHDLNDFFQCAVEDMDTHVILLSNGAYYSGNKPIENLPEGVIVCGFKDANQKYPELIEKYFDKNASSIEDGIISLNTMLANDGLFIYIPENVNIDKTIQLVNLTHGFGNKNIFKRNLFIVEKNASLKLVICDHTLNNSNNFVVDVSEAFISDNAHLEYYALQNEPNQSGVINSLIVNQERYSSFTGLALSLHGGIIRNNLYVKLSGEYSEANLYGLFLTDRNQRIDNYTFIDHAVPNCLSNELYKGILDDSAKGSFSGKILVRKDAQKTTAYQTNNNLCLTADAKMRTKPQLEIYADDVKCSHGATVGQLDENALFYLRSRGIDFKEARLMLMFAFANDILRNIKIEPLRNRVSNLINSRLRGEFSDCSHCLLNCSGARN